MEQFLDRIAGALWARRLAFNVVCLCLLAAGVGLVYLLYHTVRLNRPPAPSRSTVATARGVAPTAHETIDLLNRAAELCLRLENGPADYRLPFTLEEVDARQLQLAGVEERAAAERPDLFDQVIIDQNFRWAALHLQLPISDLASCELRSDYPPKEWRLAPENAVPRAWSPRR